MSDAIRRADEAIADKIEELLHLTTNRAFAFVEDEKRAEIYKHVSMLRASMSTSNSED
jgi:hypothetical protein